MTYLVQFYAQYRGGVHVKLKSGRGWTADEYAREAIDLAILAYTAKWPGLHVNELHVVGMYDGGRVVDSEKQEFKP